MDIIIRQETAADFPEVYINQQLAFGTEVESKLVDQIRHSNSFIPELSLIAETPEGRILGHILLTKNSIVDPQQKRYESLSLAPVSVHPEFQNKGIGSQLIRTALEQATLLGYTSVIVLGHEAYYPRFGFAPAENWNIYTAYDVPSSHFMALELQNEALKEISGIVEYPPEFESL